MDIRNLEGSLTGEGAKKLPIGYNVHFSGDRCTKSLDSALYNSSM